MFTGQVGINDFHPVGTVSAMSNTEESKADGTFYVI